MDLIIKKHEFKVHFPMRIAVHINNDNLSKVLHSCYVTQLMNLLLLLQSGIIQNNSSSYDKNNALYYYLFINISERERL